MSIRVKICGVTSVEDALAAAAVGADFVGVIVDIEGTPRAVSPAAAGRIIEKSRIPVVVLLEKTPADIERIANSLHPYAVQLIGATEPGMVETLAPRVSVRLWKTVQVPQRGAGDSALAGLRKLIERYHSAGIDIIVLDTLVVQADKTFKGGTGRVCDWNAARQLAAEAPLPLLLAGGIHPSNAREAIRTVHPWGIDVSSGVEEAPGKKDPHKIAALMRAARFA
jgi:phosphoribosylanthranilate isomerase